MIMFLLLRKKRRDIEPKSRKEQSRSKDHSRQDDTDDFDEFEE
jgi:hypothetical protein